jgi:hypothetical protein
MGELPGETPTPPMKEVNRIDVREFRERGYLQEVNRLILHPLGLALEVVIEEDGSEHLGGVWDYRDDDEGILFAGDGTIEQEKIDRVRDELEAHIPGRERLLGSQRFIQLPGDEGKAG